MDQIRNKEDQWWWMPISGDWSSDVCSSDLQEMFFPYWHCRVFRLYPYSDRTSHGPSQDPNHSRLARTPESPRHPILPRICQLLSTVHFRLFLYHRSSYPPHCHGTAFTPIFCLHVDPLPSPFSTTRGSHLFSPRTFLTFTISPLILYSYSRNQGNDP